MDGNVLPSTRNTLLHPIAARSGMPSYSACDLCFSRKVKCDKRAECQNCVDSKSRCCRTRSVVPGRRQKKSKAKGLSQLEERLARLEKSASQRSSPTSFLQNTHTYHSLSPSNTETLNQNAAPTHVSLVTCTQEDEATTSSSVIAQELSQQSTLFSSTSLEAQKAIRQALRNSSYLSEQGRNAMSAVLSKVKEMLHANDWDHGTSWSSEYTEKATEELYTIPSVEFLQEILQDPDRASRVFQYFGMVSKEVFIAMFLELLKQPQEKQDIRLSICVHCVLGWYIAEGSFQVADKTGLESYVLERAQKYFCIADAGIKQLRLLSAPSLLSIQALLCGACRLQELGEQSRGWALIAAACHMCLALGLNSRSYQSTLEDDQLRWSFQFCYAMDQGMAMLLGRSPNLNEWDIDENVFLRRPYEPDTSMQLELNYTYVDFARFQNRISSNLRSPQSRRQSPIWRQGKLHDLKEQANMLYENFLQLKLRAESTKMPDFISQVTILEFGFFSTLCIMYRSEPAPSDEVLLSEECQQAARSALALIPIIRTTVANIYGHVSVAHWSLLFYPFTAFFVLFCNVICHSEASDLRLMKEMTEFLAEIRYSNQLAARLYRLCATFCELASTIVEMEAYQRHEKLEHRSGHNVTEFDPITTRSISNMQSVPSLTMGQESTFDPATNSMLEQETSSWTQEQADILWELLISDPTSQWLEMDFPAPN